MSNKRLEFLRIKGNDGISIIRMKDIKKMYLFNKKKNFYIEMEDGKMFIFENAEENDDSPYHLTFNSIMKEWVGDLDLVGYVHLS